MFKKPEKFLYWYFPMVLIYISMVGTVFEKGSAITKIIGGFLAVSVTILNFTNRKYSFRFKWIYIYLGLIFVLILFSSKFEYSLRAYLSTYISIMVLPLSFNVIDSVEKFRKLMGFIFSLTIIYLLNILVSTYLHLGGTSYSGEIFDVGNIFTEGLNSMAYIIISAPLIIHFYPKRRILIFLILILVFVIVLVQLKRISLVAMGVGVLVNMFLYDNKKIVFRYVFITIFGFMLVFPFFIGLFEKQLIARERNLKIENLDEEGRYQETFFVVNETANSGNPLIFLFGKELFNSPGNYANGAFGMRQLHNDYMVLLHGSGFVGLIFYISWHIGLLSFFIKYKRKIWNERKKDQLFVLMRIIFISFFIVHFVISLSGGVNSLVFNTLKYAVLGSILRMFYNEYIEKEAKKLSQLDWSIRENSPLKNRGVDQNLIGNE